MLFGRDEGQPGERWGLGGLQDLFGSFAKYFLGVKRRQGDVPWDAVHRTLKLQYQPRRKVYTDDAVIAEPV